MTNMTTTQPQVPTKPVQLFHGIVKQINSGDSLVIRSMAAGRNLEKQIMLSQISSARLGRNLKPSSPESTIEPDQVHFLISSFELIDREVFFFEFRTIFLNFLKKYFYKINCAYELNI